MYKKTVLFVGDEPAILKPVTRALKRDFVVLTVSEGRRAWGAIRLFKIDCLVTDLDMSLKSGFDLLEKIRDADMKVTTIVATEGDDQLIKKRCNGLGVSTYIAKPYTLGSIRKMIDVMKCCQDPI